MKNQDKALSAIRSVFPTMKGFSQLADDPESGEIVRSLAEFARKSGLIESADRNALAGLIEEHAELVRTLDLPKQMTFEEFLDNKNELLGLKISVRSWTDRMNALLEEHGIELPRVSNSMLSRLKKEPADTIYKQNVLRSINFWIGHERGELGSTWNYDALFNICSENIPAESFSDGARIGFALSSRGDFIDHKVVNWLKKALKECLDHGAEFSRYRHTGKIRSHNITTFYVDFPREGEVSDPAGYRQCLRSAVSLAHQVAIRWAISDFCTQKRFLAIGIVAGEYAHLDGYLTALLNAKLPGDPVIRVADYVRQYLLINDVRVILDSQGAELALANGEIFSVWSVVGLWSFIYFDFVPELLNDPVLGHSQGARSALANLLWNVGEDQGEIGRNAVSTYLSAPQNTLLGTEIAKTLYFRRQFAAANEILRIVLSVNPSDLVARTLRMVLYRSMALEAPGWPGARSLFRMAEQEAAYLQENGFARVSEDFLCEFGIVLLSRACRALKTARAEGVAGSLREELRGEFFKSIDRAEDLFEKGITVSPSGIRSSYLLGSVRILRALIRDNEALLFDAKLPLDGRCALIRQEMRDLLRQRGYALSADPTRTELAMLEKRLVKRAWLHNDSVSLSVYRPTICYTGAVVFWDYVPFRTVGLAKRVLRLLQEAEEMAGRIAEQGVGIYTFSRICGEVIPPEQFISHIRQAMARVRELAGEGFLGRDDREILPCDDDRMGLLVTLNF